MNDNSTPTETETAVNSLRGSYPKRCTECGATVRSFEQARIHARDLHGGIQPNFLGYFEEGDSE